MRVTANTYLFTRNMLNFPDATKTFPTGTWSKASDTSKISEFIIYMCETYDDKVSQDKMLHYIDLSCKALRKCMRGLYSADLWVEPQSTLGDVMSCFGFATKLFQRLI